MKAKLTPDNRWIVVSDSDGSDVARVRQDFCKKYDNWFVLKSKNPNIPAEENFMNDYGMTPVGLWVELINTCVKFGINLEFEPDFNSKLFNDLDRPSFDKYVSELFTPNENTKPKDYQIDGCFNVLKYKKCCMEVSTSGGKTLMSYIIFRYALKVLGIKHILFITPNTNLTKQTLGKFVLYDQENGLMVDWTASEIHSKAKKKDEYDDTIVFANYQSACKKQQEFFDKFDMLIIDEGHHIANSSITKIIKRCKNAEYKIGMTGTFPKEGTHKNFVIQAYMGPIVYRLSSYALINEEKFATPVHVSVLVLNYLEEDKKKAMRELRMHMDRGDITAGANLLSQEEGIARNHPARFKYVCNLLKSTTKNSLAIFSDIQEGYGKRVYDFVKENSDKHVFYIDGHVDPETRKNIIEVVENDTTGGSIIVASMGCFSEGIDIANIWNIFLLEDTKSDTIMAQILGRGMRRYEGKEKTNMIDIVDDFRYGKGYKSDNYLYSHGVERMEKIYKARGFPYKIFYQNC